MMREAAVDRTARGALIAVVHVIPLSHTAQARASN